MPKYPKGILGVRKDPKNQILFSFNVREGDEWPSDDDEDDDYRPDDDSDSDAKIPAAHGSQKRRKVVHRRQKTVKKQKQSTDVDQSVCKSSNNKKVVPMLPPELWEKIFLMVVKQEGSLPFLLRAEKVCQMWKEVSGHPNLWGKVDMSPYDWKKTSETKLKSFCRKRLRQCKELNISGCHFMNHSWGVNVISNNCLALRTLNLSQCKKLPNGSVEKIVTACRYLEDIDLNSTTSDAVSSQTLNCIVDKCGANLKRIVVANNMVKSINTFLTSLTEKCPNLEHLDVSNVKYHSGCLTFDIETFQQHCPKLKTLYLANVVVRSELPNVQVMENSPGFVCLEELSVANYESNSYLRSNFIERVLKNATKLRLIDIRGCIATQVVSILNQVDCPNLEQLYLSKSEAATCSCLGEIVQKWRHSLTHLDLSWNNFSDNVLESALRALCDGPSNLTHLDLSGTRVNMEYLRKALLCHTKLECLDLSSCRDLDRGCKRSYKTLQEIKQLRKSLKL